MTVNELIAQLKDLPLDAEVILQKDSEGNGYSPAAGAEVALYEKESSYSGWVYSVDDPEGQGEQAVVIWPVN